MLNHTGGTFSHSGMMDCPRFPFLELHLAKFLDSMEFESWKLNFRTGVCRRTSESSDHYALDQRN